MRASPKRIFIDAPSSRTPAEGHSRFSIWTLNLVFQISICFLPFILFFFLILQLGATLTTDDIAHPRGVKCGQCRWLGGRRLVSLFAALCISGGGVWTAGGDRGAGACLLEPKDNADFTTYKVAQCLLRTNGKSANQQQLVMNATLAEPKRPANNTTLSAADGSS